MPSTDIVLGRKLNLNTYLEYVHSFMKGSLKDQKKVVLVLGSGNGQTDSVCGSICLAYYYFMLNSGCKYIKIEEAETVYVPLMNVKRKKFEAQLETLYILEAYDVAEKYLLTLSEVNLEEFVKN
jgi:inorganic pyrophosphatase/exopolyphosphatase